MIKLLPQEVIRKIAAGEVVESPGSVVRELLENSIDAKSRNIDIHIRNSGLELIEVKDDGTGMEKSDLELATKRYATSKIESLEDLQKDFTLGFRGEALYSIAQVSKLVIISGNGKEAWKASYKGEEIISLEPYSTFKGTIVRVEDLFYNFPVRREFTEANLRKAKKELNDIINNFLVAFPHIGFRIKWDDKKSEIYPVKEIELERYMSIFGEDFVREMKDFIVEEDEIKIYGFFKKPQYLSTRKRGIERVFVNRRRVNLDFVRIAIRSAFAQENVIPEFLVFMELPPYFFDFNVHPQKKEVKIYNEKRLFSLLYHAVRKALMEERIVLSDIKKDENAKKMPDEDHGADVPDKLEERGEYGGLFELRDEARQLEFGEVLPFDDKGKEKEIPYYVPEKLFQIHNSYIIAEVETGIIIVDQHAAHERIIYEKLKKKKSGTKRLLFPVAVELNREELDVFEEYRAILESMGFEFRSLGGKTIVIDGIPSVFDAMDKDIFKGLLNDLQSDLNLPDKHQYTLKTIACKAAIKAGQKLSREEMAALLDELFACDVPFFCPHGRPLIYKISLLELEKKFGRT